MMVRRSVTATRASRPNAWKLPLPIGLAGSIGLWMNRNRASVSERGSFDRIGFEIGPMKLGNARSLSNGRRSCGQQQLSSGTQGAASGVEGGMTGREVGVGSAARARERNKVADSPATGKLLRCKAM